MTAIDHNHSDSAKNHYFFAGGGTGGHIYPNIAVAQALTTIQPDASITFLCSNRPLDAAILSRTPFRFLPLCAQGFSKRPDRAIKFLLSQIRAYWSAKKTFAAAPGKKVLVSCGGFASAPAVLAAHKLKIPIVMINVDFTPGRANKLLASLASKIFVQFPDTADYFKKTRRRVTVVGCPLRKEFADPQPAKAISDLELDPEKKILLITGGSSGARNIDNAVCELLNCLSFADSWQILHITSALNYEKVLLGYGAAKIDYKILQYYDDMANLYAAADIVIGRSGAVSVAEYAAAGVPVICLPYPYHDDKHQYLNAKKLAAVGAAIIVHDSTDTKTTAKTLAKQLLKLMADDAARYQMRAAASNIAKPNAAKTIAKALTTI